MVENNIEDDLINNEIHSKTNKKNHEFFYNKHGVYLFIGPASKIVKLQITSPKRKCMSISSDNIALGDNFNIDKYRDESSTCFTFNLKKFSVCIDYKDHEKSDRTFKQIMIERSLKNERLFSKLNATFPNHQILPKRTTLTDKNGNEIIDTLGFGGACPMQGWGYIDGEEFYFRFRSNIANLSTDTLSATKYNVYEKPGSEYEGFIDDEKKLIEILEELIKNLTPIDEITNPTSYMRMKHGFEQNMLSNWLTEDINNPKVDKYISELEDGKYKERILASVSKVREKAKKENIS